MCFFLFPVLSLFQFLLFPVLSLFQIVLSCGSGSGSGGVGGGTGADDDDDDDDQVVFKMDNLQFPSCYKFSTGNNYNSVMMVGSCNGLICLHDSELRDVSLWNPATRQFRILPKSLSLFEEDALPKSISLFADFYDNFYYDFIMFGFDAETKDYKVVQITWCRREMEYTCRGQVYSLSTNSWRLLEGINSSIPQDRMSIQGLYLNGSYFFVGRTLQYSRQSNGTYVQGWNNDKLMCSFDFSKEIFTTMQFPDLNPQQCLVLGNYFSDKIALFTTQRASSTGDQSPCDCDDYDIWVLNEHGGGGMNKEPWTKLHSFRIKVNGHINPKGISNNGEFALIETRTNGDIFRKLQLFNLITKEAQKKDFAIVHPVLRAHIYKQSLVSIIGGGNGAAAAAAAAADR